MNTPTVCLSERIPVCHGAPTVHAHGQVLVGPFCLTSRIPIVCWVVHPTVRTAPPMPDTASLSPAQQAAKARYTLGKGLLGHSLGQALKVMAKDTTLTDRDSL